VPMQEFLTQRSQYAQGMGGLPIVGDPNHVAAQIADLSKAGLTGIAISLINYIDELPFFCEEVLGRLARMGLREKPRD
jgi:dimethylsulfone monooxygenase